MNVYWIVLFHFIIVNAFPYPVESSPASAHGIGRPRLKPFHFDSNLIDGKAVRVFCELSDGAVPVSFKWLKDGQQLPMTTNPSSNTGHISIAAYSDYSTLVINRVDRRRDNGNYTCFASNSYGTGQFSSMLNVKEPPTFQEKPSDVSIGLGQSRMIQCRATSSYTIPEIRWNRILTNVNSAGLVFGKDARREHIATGEQLHLADVREQDAGVYECVADSHSDLTISHTFTVTVNVPASFETKTDLYEVKRGETAKLVCEVNGAKPVTIKWYRQNGRTGKFEEIDLDLVPESFTYPRYTALEKNFDQTNQSGGKGHHLHGINRHYVNNNRTLFELHINSVNSMDNGRYECVARNGYGEDHRRLDLFVQDVPGPVRQLHVNTIWSREVLITWLSPEMIGNSPIIQYVIQYWKEVRLVNQTQSTDNDRSFSGGQRLHEIEMSPTETQSTIKNLKPGTTYVIRVIAVNGFGRGPASSSVRVITQEEAPDAAPIDINIEPMGTTALRVRWKAPQKNHWNGQLRGYYLGYRLIANNVDNIGNNDLIENNSADSVNNEILHQYAYKEAKFNGMPSDNYQEEYHLTGLARASQYSIIIKSFNGAGEGPNSQEIIATTTANDPPPKPQLWSIETKENSIQLKWEQKPSASEITHYIFFYKDEKKTEWMEMTYVPTVNGADQSATSAEQQQQQQTQPANTFELIRLHSGTVYQIYMRSVAEKGVMSEPSNLITVRTEGEIPLVSLDSLAHTYPVAPIPTIYSSHLQPPSPTYPYGPTSTQSVPPYLRLAFVLPVMIAAVVIVIACVSAYVYIRVDDRKAKMKTFNSATNGIYAGTVAVPAGKRFQFISPGGGGGGIGPNTSALSLAHSSMASGMNGFNKHDLSTQSLVSEEGSLSFRYSDTSSDKCRPLLASRPPGSGGMMPTGVMWAQQQTPIMEEDEAIVEVSSSTYETLPFQKDGRFAFQSNPMSSFNAGQPLSKMNTSNSNHSSNSNKSARSPAFPPPPPPLPGANVGRSPSNTNGKPTFCHVDVHHVQSSNASDANNSDSYDEFHFFTPDGAQHV